MSAARRGTTRAAALALALAAALLAATATAAEARPRAVQRCGWFVNPTPSNAWLVDREAEWTVSTQGSDGAEGDWPRFKPSQWVRTNGSYGHGCACMGVVADAETHTVSEIRWTRTRPLAACRNDRALPKPN